MLIKKKITHTILVKIIKNESANSPIVLALNKKYANDDMNICTRHINTKRFLKLNKESRDDCTGQTPSVPKNLRMWWNSFIVSIPQHSALHTVFWFLKNVHRWNFNIFQIKQGRKIVVDFVAKFNSIWLSVLKWSGWIDDWSFYI